MQLPKMEDVVARLEGEVPVEKNFTIDLHALFHAALMNSLRRRQDRLAYAKRLRRAHLLYGRNPYKKRHTIARVKRAQYGNAKKGRKVYKRSFHGGHF